MTRMRRILTALLVLVIAGLGLLHVKYPLPYVFNVMVRQGPDYYDHQVFPASAIAPAEVPTPLPATPDPAVLALFESHPDIDGLDAFMQATDTTALLIIHDGQLVLERYGRGHDANSTENSFSVSKAVASMLVGLAAADGDRPDY